MKQKRAHGSFVTFLKVQEQRVEVGCTQRLLGGYLLGLGATNRLRACTTSAITRTCTYKTHYLV